MKRLNLFSILFTLILLLLVPNLVAAMIVEEATKIPYQVNNTDRIVIGTVSEIDIYRSYTIYTITVKEWLYNPLPVKTIKVKSKIGANLWVEDEAEFTKNESTLIMLKNVDLDKQLFSVTFGFPGKHPIADRDAVIEELKAQGKWPEENQTENKTNETGMTEKAGKQNGESNSSQKSNTTPFISPICLLAAILGAVIYIRKKQ